MLKALFGRLNSHWRQAKAVRLRRSVRKRAKRYRPMLEGLEGRDLMAFNMFITPAATANVSSATANGTTTFTAAAAGANLNVDDIDAALNAGNNVVVISGSSGTQAGTIATNGFNTHLFNNAPGTTLTIQNGSGNGSDAGDINITGLRLKASGTMILNTNDQVILEGTISADSMTISAGGTITMPNGGQLVADSLSLTAGGDIGTQADFLFTSVSSLTADTSASNRPQFITEANGLTALNLDAGIGGILLVVAAGNITDFDFQTDITANGVSVTLSGNTDLNFGTSNRPINTSVNLLLVHMLDGGNQFITEANGLTGLNLDAGTGNVTLALTAGAVTDTDTSTDLQCSAAIIALNDASAMNFGASANPINTDVNSLSVDTSAGKGSQFITEDNSLTALLLNAGSTNAGNLSLTVQAGGIGDTDADVDVRGQAATIVFGGVTGGGVGTVDDPIQTDVVELSIDTAATSGNQFITESNGLGELALDAGLGNVACILLLGSVNTIDASVDITAASVSVTLQDSKVRDFGTAARSIRVNANTLAVDTSLGGGNQFFGEANTTFLTGNAGTGSITLSGGTFELVAGDAIGDLSTLVVDLGVLVNLAGNDETFGGLAGSGTVAFKPDGIEQTFIVGLNNQNTIFSGNLTGNDLMPGVAVDRLRKVGTGALTIEGDVDFTGQPEVNAGKLLVNGSFAASSQAVIARIAGTLGGSGNLNRNVLVASGARLAPGNSAGTLRTNTLSMNGGATFDVEISSAGVGGFDQATTANGVLNLGNASGLPSLNIIAGATVILQSGNSVVLIDNAGTNFSTTGTFNNLPEGASLGSNFLGSGLTATITYRGISGSDNDVVIKLTPGFPFPWHNENKPLDVSGGQTVDPDGAIVAGDALQVINYLNGLGAGAVPGNAVLGLPFGFLDTDGDNFVTAGDVLEVINFLNAGFGGEGEGAASADCGVDPRSGYPDAECKPGPAAAVDVEELIGLLAMDVAEVAGRRRRA